MSKNAKLLILLVIVALCLLLMAMTASAASSASHAKHLRRMHHLRAERLSRRQYYPVETTTPPQQATDDQATETEEPPEVTEPENIPTDNATEVPEETEEEVTEVPEATTEVEEEVTEVPEATTEEEVPEATPQETEHMGGYRFAGMKRQNGEDQNGEDQNGEDQNGEDQNGEVEDAEGLVVEQQENQQGQNQGVEQLDEEEAEAEPQALQQQAFQGEQNAEFFNLCRTRHFCYRRNPFYSVRIPATSNAIYFSPRLLRNRWYLIRCYGTWKPIRRRGYFCDCRWCTRNNWNSRSDSLGGYDYGLCSRELSGGGACRDNFWRPNFSRFHSYCYEYRGRGVSVDLRVRDPFHFNNRGALFCSIYRQC